MSTHQYSSPEWTRYGRGRRFSWHATDDEVAEFVELQLPKDFAPYSLIYSKWVKTARRQGYWEEAENLVTLFRQITCQGTFSLLLRSHCLTPKYSPQQEGIVTVGNPPSSLIVLQHHHGKSHEALNCTSIGLVDKFLYEPTQAVYLSDAYLPLFSIIKQWWLKKLTCEVAYPYGNGKLQRFKATPAFVDQLQSSNCDTELVVTRAG